MCVLQYQDRLETWTFDEENLITIALLNYTADLFFWSIGWPRRCPTAKLLLLEHCSLINLNSSGQILLLFISHFFILFYNNSMSMLSIVWNKELNWIKLVAQKKSKTEKQPMRILCASLWRHVIVGNFRPYLSVKWKFSGGGGGIYPKGVLAFKNSKWPTVPLSIEV